MKPWLKRHLAKKKAPKCSRCRKEPKLITLSMTHGERIENFRLGELCIEVILLNAKKKPEEEARAIETAIHTAMKNAGV